MKTTPRTQRIVECVASRFQIPVERVLSAEKTKSVALARMLCVYIMRQHGRPSLSYPELGREFGIDPATARNACLVCAVEVSKDPWLRGVVDAAARTGGHAEFDRELGGAAAE